MSLFDSNPVLREILDTKVTRTPNGESVALDSYIDAKTAEALYRQLRAQKPQVAVEIGMANAISTLAILTALEENGGEGRLVSIDPNQGTQWRNCGRAAVQRAGLSHRHQVMEEADWSALPRLHSLGTRIEFGYIDGWHTFDYALLDFWYLDKMLRKDGIVAFNDCDWPAVAKVMDFVLTHRRYCEIDAGLPKAYQRPGGVVDILRKVKHGRLGDYFRQGQDRYFRKMEEWEPTWNYFKAF
jgi:predicted O-methyltransferase YrrM